MRKEILENVKKIRQYINSPKNINRLTKNKVRWIKICVSLDTIEDTCEAINFFSSLPLFDFDSGGYLYFYGLLQALFLQQDAARNLSLELVNRDISYKKMYPELYDIREIRNQSIGHPTSKDKDESFHFVSRITININGFQLISFFPKKEKKEYKNIDIFKVIITQEKIINEILLNINNNLNI